MMKRSNLPPVVRRIAIFRALYLGDLLLAIPAFRAIRRKFPEAEITLIGLPWAASFVHRFARYIDRFVEFAGYPGIQEVDVDPERTKRFLAEQRAYGYDLVVQMHGSGRTSNPFVLALGGGATVGYYEEMQPSQSSQGVSSTKHGCPEDLTLGAVYPENFHEVLRNLGLAALLGCTELDTSLEFPLFQEDYAEANALLRSLQRGRPRIALHAGARPPARRWPAEYFATVADALASQFDAQILLTGGPGEEETVQAVACAMRTSAENLGGKTSLGGLGALISSLNLFISNDTGPAHVACAVGCPSITIFGPADYQRWAPLDSIRHPAVRHSVACSPCGYWKCPIDHRCLRWLSPASVLNVAHQLLTRKTSSCNV